MRVRVYRYLHWSGTLAGRYALPETIVASGGTVLRRDWLDASPLRLNGDGLYILSNGLADNAILSQPIKGGNIVCVHRVITLMPDFGGAYAWGRDSIDEPGIGPCIADAISGFPDVYGVPKRLDRRMSEWGVRFERGYDSTTFDWAAFHLEGIGLACELQHVLGPSYTVYYDRPWEAPDRHVHAVGVKWL
jgi:hypothetical protein